MDEFKEIFDAVRKPGRYTGGEINSVRKQIRDGMSKIVLAYPDMYEVGMSYLGFRILYHLLNEREDVVCERVFMPARDMALELSKRRKRLFSLESRTPLNKFDIIGFSLSYELTYTNVLSMLNMGGIEVRSDKRAEDQPLVIAGGTCCYNPEPMSAFIDAFLIGDGEELLPDFVREYRGLKDKGLNKKNSLKVLSKMRGVYVPSMYRRTDDYENDPVVIPLNDEVPGRVESAVVDDLENAYYPRQQIVPFIKIVHDRIAVEIMRGCPNKCRFCQAGYVNRPLRLRSPEKIRNICIETYRRTGNDRVALLSLSSVNYPYLRELVKGVNEDFREKGVGVSIPSLRVDRSFYELPEMLSIIRKGGLTFAPETANPQISRAIGKDIDPEVLCGSAGMAFRSGWRSLKLYFMVGFPGVIPDEEKGIIELARRVSFLKGPRPGNAAEVKVSVNPFIPKAQTPFQWFGMKPREELEKKRKILIAGSTRKIKVDFHDIGQSVLEGCLARGGREISDVIYSAWERGAEMDGWSEFFDLSVWEKAFTDHGMEMQSVACREFLPGKSLPWDHISAGVSKELLKREMSDSGLSGSFREE